MASSDVYIARQSFVAQVEGKKVFITEGVTRVRRGHALLKGREHLFEPADAHVHFEVEQATAAPGEKRGIEDYASGVGWYDIPGIGKVRGAAAAREALGSGE